jgi:ABC-type glycerol-3-phosphate transport system substrate-binding protein
MDVVEQRPGAVPRRGLVSRPVGRAGASTLAALGLAAGRARPAGAQSLEGEDAPASPEPAAPEAGATAVPALQRTLLLDADWIGTDNARGRHAQFWIDTWKERNPSYTIDFQAKGDVIVRLASDTYGHMIQFPPTIFAVFRGKPGLFVGIDREMAARRITADSFFGIPEIETWEGQRFGIPLQTNVFGWMYNRSRFEQLGVPLPDDRWTYEDAVEAGKRLTRADAAPPQWGLRWRHNWDILPILRAAQVAYLSADKERVTLDTPQGVAALEFVLDAVHRHRVAPTEQWRTDNNATFAPADVSLGYFAMLDGSTGTKATQLLLEEKGIRWENMWPPRWRGSGTRSVLIDGHPWMTMDRAIKDGVETACVDLLLHLLDEPVQEQYLIQGTGMPALKAMAYDPRFVAPPPESLRLQPEIWQFGQTYDRFAGGIDMLSAWDPHLKRAWNGEIGARELATQLTRDGTAAIQGVARPPWGR